MKILLVHHRLPYPPFSGMDKATINLIKILSSSHDVTLVIPVDMRYSAKEDIERAHGLCHKLITVQVKSRTKAMQKRRFWYWWRFVRFLFLIPDLVTEYFYPVMAREVKKICKSEKFDIVQAISLASAEYLRFAAEVPKVIIAHEAHFNLSKAQWHFSKGPFRRLILWLNYLAYLKYERKVYSSCDYLLALSAEDLQKIDKLAGGLSYARLIPDPVEADDFPHSRIMSSIRSHDPYRLIFVGGLGPSFNQDAVLYFCKDIFPLIKRSFPKVKFYIVGENPPNYIKELERYRGIIVTGRVPDVRPYIERAGVYVAPIRYGGGVKSKIIEALGMGKAIVATSVAIRGLDDHGKDVFRVQDEPEGFAREVVDLIHNEEIRFSLGMNARSLFEQSYSLKAVTPKILNIYDEISKSISSHELKTVAENQKASKLSWRN